MVSFGFTWFYWFSCGLTWLHLVSFCFTWYHLVSLGFTWISLGLTWTHLTHSGSLGLTWIHLHSLGLTGTHCTHSTIQGKREDLPVQKGKGKGLTRYDCTPTPLHIQTPRVARTHARNETMSRLRGAGLKADSLPQTSDIWKH